MENEDKKVVTSNSSKSRTKKPRELSKIYTIKKKTTQKEETNKKKNATKKKSVSKNKKPKNNSKKNISQNKSKDKAGIVIGATSIISLLLIMVVFGELYLMDSSNSNVLSYNANVNGINVGGMELTKANEKLVSAFNEKAENFELNLSYKDKNWKLTNKDFEINSNIYSILEEAYLRGTNSSYEIQKNTTNQIIKNGGNVTVAFNYVFLGLDEKIDEILNEIEIAPTNSEVIFNSRSKAKFYITEEKNGYTVNKEKLYEEINRQFLIGNKININLELEETRPEITKEDNEKITYLRSSFSTNVADSTGARKTNVKVALSKIDGLKINPGESVSFNYLTGPHTLDNGYKVATIIYNGRFTDGVGGGICQASTTLYNALIRADIQIDEVNKHTLPVKYVPLALDAMVAEYISDLRFTNNLDCPIFISAYTDSEKAYVDIYGEKMEDGLEIKTRSETIRTIKHGGDNVIVDTNKEYTDKVLFKGEYYRLTYPKDGYEVKAYLDYYKNGELIEEKLIRHETYQPQNGIVIEGSAEPIENMNPIESGVIIER